MVVRPSIISLRSSFISYPVHNLLGALVFTDFLSVQNGGFCLFFLMRFVMCEIQPHLLLHFTMQHRFRLEETTEKMQASFRTGDEIETIKKSPPTLGKQNITSVSQTLISRCPLSFAPPQNKVSFYVFRTTMGRPDHYCRSFSGSEQQHLVLFFLSLAAGATGGGKQKLFVSFSHRAVGRG